MGKSYGMMFNLKNMLLALSLLVSGSAFAQSAMDVHCHNILPEYMDHILYGSDYPYLPDNVLMGNKNRMEEQFSADSELAPYVGGFFGANAARLFQTSGID